MTEQEIIASLGNRWRESGINPGEVVLVHSSLKRILLKANAEFGVKITPQIVYQSLRYAVGTEGTLVLPLFNFDFPKTKYFDIRNTPSQMGALTEIGRTDPEAVRTGHPIYSFSVTGRKAVEFQGIDNYSGYGSDSPFAKIKALNGKIAIIGLTDQDSMTSYHFVEEQNQVNYRYFKIFEGTYIDQSGAASTRKYALFVRDIEKGVVTDVNRMMNRLWHKGLYTGDQPDEGYGMRTIFMRDFYQETESVIRSGEAANFLYSIKQPG